MTDAPPPPPEVVFRAIELYLAEAYDGPVSPGVAERLARLRAAPPREFYDSEAFEREPREAPERYSLRLGCRHYPHMKLVIERMPSQGRWLFRADTHDRHLQLEPSMPEWDAFQALVARNQALATAIEAAWERADLDTFKRVLRCDLEARRSRAPDVHR